MEATDLILLNEFCIHHEVELSFINSLNEAGLITIIILEDKEYINQEELSALEKIIRMHNELEINIEGIDVINQLLQRVNHLNEEINSLKNRLRFYEEN